MFVLLALTLAHADSFETAKEALRWTRSAVLCAEAEGGLTADEALNAKLIKLYRTPNTRSFDVKSFMPVSSGQVCVLLQAD